MNIIMKVLRKTPVSQQLTVLYTQNFIRIANITGSDNNSTLKSFEPDKII